MNWDYNELLTKLFKIEKLLNSNIDDETRRDLLLDRYNIKYLIKYAFDKYMQPYAPKEIFEEFNQDKSRKEVMLRLVSTDEIRELAKNIDYSYIPRKSLFVKRISEPKYLELVHEFFEEFDPRISSFMDQLVNQNRSLFSTKRHEKGTVLGECTPIISDNSSYISTRFNGSYSVLTTFPHEVGHAFQQRNHINYNDIRRYSNSLFTETYPQFIEFAFTDFLKSKGYDKISRVSLSDKLFTLSSQFEFLFPELYSVPGSQVENNSFVPKSKTSLGLNRVNYSAPSVIYSSLLATHLYNIYKQDKDKGMQQVESFNNQMHNSTDSAILDTYDPQTLSLSFGKLKRNI